MLWGLRDPGKEWGELGQAIVLWQRYTYRSQGVHARGWHERGQIIVDLESCGPVQFWWLRRHARPPKMCSAASATREPTTLSWAKLSCSGTASYVTHHGVHVWLSDADNYEARRLQLRARRTFVDFIF